MPGQPILALCLPDAKPTSSQARGPGHLELRHKGHAYVPNPKKDVQGGYAPTSHRRALYTRLRALRERASPGKA